MYVKTIKKTKEWRFGIEYFNSEVGDILKVNTVDGFAMIQSEVAIRAPFSETANLGDEIAEVSGIGCEDVFEVRLKALEAKEGE